VDILQINRSSNAPDRLVTNFGYVPTTVPGLPSPLRRLAYSEGNGLLGPDGDPEGWKVLPPVKVKGALFDGKEVDVDCTVRDPPSNHVWVFTIWIPNYPACDSNPSKRRIVASTRVWPALTFNIS